MQLRRDPRPLVAHRQRGVGLALLLELAGALGELGRDQLALAQRAPGAPARAGTRIVPARSPCAVSTAQLGRADQRRSAAIAPASARLRAAGAERVRPAPAAYGRASRRPTGRSRRARATADQPRGARAGAGRGRARRRARPRRAARGRRRARPRSPAAPSERRRERRQQVGAAQPTSPPEHGQVTPRPRRDRRARSPRASRGAAARARARARSPPAAAPARRPGDRRARARRRAKRTPTSTSGASSSASSSCSTIRYADSSTAGGQRPRAALDGQPGVRALRARTSSASRWVSVGCGAVGAPRRRARSTPTTARISSSVAPALALDRRRAARSPRPVARRAPRVGQPRELAEPAAAAPRRARARQARAVGGDLEPGTLVARARSSRSARCSSSAASPRAWTSRPTPHIAAVTAANTAAVPGSNSTTRSRPSSSR